MKINFVDLKKQYTPLLKRILTEFERIINTSSYVGGAILNEFEENVAKFINTRYCVGVGSGTDALILSLLALGIGPGDEVILPANTFIATAFAVSHVGAKPVFVDVDPDTYLIDVHLINKAITDRTKAIIPVHLYGNVCNIEALKSLFGIRGIKIVEDCAQAFGAQYKQFKAGSMGDIGCFSFYPAKNLGGIGQGGCITTNDKDLANHIRSLGDMGRDLSNRYKHVYIGFNSRLDTINAAFLNIMLKYIDEWNYKRIGIANVYNSCLARIMKVKTPTVNKNSMHIYHLYEIKCPNKHSRESLYNYLFENGIGVGLHYPVPCHLQEPYKNLNYRLPITEELSNTLLSLPMHPNLSYKEIEYVCNKIDMFYEEYNE